MTVTDLLTATLKRIGVVQPGNTPSYEDLQDSFVRLQTLQESWQNDRLLIPYVLRTTWTMTANIGGPTSPFTVGTGGTIAVLRPTYIDRVTYQDTSLTYPEEITLNMMTDDAYQAIPIKTLTSTYPSQCYYNPTYASSRGSLYLWPVPTSASLQGVLYAPANIAAYAAVTDTITLPQGYVRFVRDNLALELWPEFREDAPVPQALLASARESKDAIKTINLRPMDLGMDPAYGGNCGWYDIYSDTFR